MAKPVNRYAPLAALVGAATSAPLGLLAHRQEWGPFRYDSYGQAAAFAAGIGALNALIWYYGIERYLRETLPLSPGAPPPTETGTAI